MINEKVIALPVVAEQDTNNSFVVKDANGRVLCQRMSEEYKVTEDDEYLATFIADAINYFGASLRSKK